MDKEKHLVDKNRFMKSGKKNWFILTMLTMLALLWVADGQRPCLALSIAWTGSASTTWAIGTKSASQTSTSTGSPTTWTVTNDSSPAVTESITIKVTSVTWTSAASAWTTGTAAGSNVYVLTLKSPGDTIMGTTATTLASGLAGSGTKGFGLAFTTPSSSTEQGAHTLTITLTAVTYVQPGFAAGGAYWYAGTGVCNDVCTPHGVCVAAYYDAGLKSSVCYGVWPNTTNIIGGSTPYDTPNVTDYYQDPYGNWKRYCDVYSQDENSNVVWFNCGNSYTQRTRGCPCSQ